MNNIQKRFILFLLGCIPSRLVLIYLAKKYAKVVAYSSIFFSIGFMYIYINNKRKTGAEVMGDTIWWNQLRPIHSMLFGLFALVTLSNILTYYTQYTWLLLVADTLLGLLAFLYYHYSHNHFKLIFE